MGALTFDKLLIIGVIAMLIFGPDRLPGLAAQFAQLVKRAKGWSETAKERVSEELGEDFDIEDWRKLDPRQYDPRRIIRDAWFDLDSPAKPAAASAATVGAGIAAATSAAAASAMGASSRPAWAAGAEAGGAAAEFRPGYAPFDDEAT